MISTVLTIEMAWAAKRLDNEQLTGFFTGSLTTQFYLLLFTGQPTIFQIPLSLNNVIKSL